ncbi:MAG: 3-isopropylmalate dehydratase large subunit [Gammaproteobacteria bacterium]
MQGKSESGSSGPRTLFGKVWDRHVIFGRERGPALIYIDRDLVHEGSFHAFAELRRRGLAVRRPRQSFGMADHYAPTGGRRIEDAKTPEIGQVLRKFDENMRWSGMHHFGLSDPRQGIVHVVAPELGITQPGLTVVCSDSHTSTQGALGALAFGIGQSENTLVLATQSLWLERPKTLCVTVDGRREPGISAKDVMLAIIARVGAGGAGGHAVEYAGPVVRAMSIEERFTLCNMSVEAAARCGMVAPDDATFEYLHGRPYAPAGPLWDRALAYWKTLPSDPGAAFDREVTIDGGAVEPMVTWGTSPEDALPIGGVVPDPQGQGDAARRANMQTALEYMDLRPGRPLAGLAIDRVFIGSCTNSRIEDLRAAAAVFAGHKAAVPAMVVPGSTQVKRQAEAEGLDRIFRDAGVQWLESGCSMCVAINGDIVAPGERCASTSNRNFPGRQGPGARTHLMSPAMAAAAAVTGRLTDVRRLLAGR